MAREGLIFSVWSLAAPQVQQRVVSCFDVLIVFLKERCFHALILFEVRAQSDVVLT